MEREQLLQIIDRLSQKVGFLEVDIITLQVLLEKTKKENEDLMVQLESMKGEIK